jgi:hypothetical protein
MAAKESQMKLTIELPKSKTPRTHTAGKVAAEYVAFELSKLDPSAFTEMYRDGYISGQIQADFVGVVKWTLSADK